MAATPVCYAIRPLCHLEYFHDHARIEGYFLMGLPCPYTVSCILTYHSQVWGCCCNAPMPNPIASEPTGLSPGRSDAAISGERVHYTTEDGECSRRASVLGADLQRRVEGEVRFDTSSRGLYATDASSYPQAPIGVVIPRHIEDVVETVAALLACSAWEPAGICKRTAAPGNRHCDNSGWDIRGRLQHAPISSCRRIWRGKGKAGNSNEVTLGQMRCNRGE